MSDPQQWFFQRAEEPLDAPVPLGLSNERRRRRDPEKRQRRAEVHAQIHAAVIVPHGKPRGHLGGDRANVITDAWPERFKRFEAVAMTRRMDGDDTRGPVWPRIRLAPARPSPRVRRAAAVPLVRGARRWRRARCRGLPSRAVVPSRLQGAPGIGPGLGKRRRPKPQTCFMVEDTGDPRPTARGPRFDCDRSHWNRQVFLARSVATTACDK